MAVMIIESAPLPHTVKEGTAEASRVVVNPFPPSHVTLENVLKFLVKSFTP